MTELSVPLALLGILKVSRGYLVVDSGANDACRLTYSDLARHFLQVLVICGEMMADIVDGDTIQRGRITLLTGLLIVTTTLPKQHLMKCVVGSDGSVDELIQRKARDSNREMLDLFDQFGSFACSHRFAH